MKPRWLTAEEQRTWRAYRDLSLLLEDTLDQQLRHDAGLSHLYYSVLVFLSEAPDRRLRMTDLAEQLKVARSRLTYVIGRMVGEGWVCREGNSGDKRGQLAVLTDVGMAVLENAAPGHAATVRATVFDRLTPEQVHAFGEACETILAGLTDPDGPITNPPWRR
ncbi:MarR family winged helix-turn-helix transcriptional regulator [Amycolatopsis sp. YIM 10]|uniref:MarR family winged helix-turn-helix transcriptional regulator n=1 Tax=Amycolatopsis sp. YIM 10 TaxID=2653857 RepID=UPI00128FE22A|nr:MarR family transcriptional regulator [Amycolatopsis sp. YIM 10]QFU91692.1 HTH-type transcriptional regulator MhqR [Amycolatopsis sp. YIM 10]